MPQPVATPRSDEPARRGGNAVTLISLWVVLCLALAYVPDLGRGFISDDYGWIVNSRLESIHDVPRLFTAAPMGFYRPLTSLSFSVSQAVFGTAPFGYGMTNLALVLAIGAAVAWLCVVLGFGRYAAVFGAALWMFNLRGIGMAVMWISGRTSLLATLWAVFAAIATSRGRHVVAGMCVLAALLSKEEPLLLPLVLSGWVAIDRSTAGDRLVAALRGSLRHTWPSYGAVAIYLALRQPTGAIDVANAPPYYALSLSPRLLIWNTLEYADRSMTFAAAVLLIGVLGFSRQLPWLDADERRSVAKGALWLVCGFGLTVMVPVRSDLYACLPSIGVSLMATAVGAALWRAIPVGRRAAAAMTALALPLLLVPVYRARNASNRRNAVLAEQIVDTVRRELANRPDIERVDLFQHEGERPSARAALGGALPLALRWRAARRIESSFHTPSPDSDERLPPGAMHVHIAHGQVSVTAGPE